MKRFLSAALLIAFGATPAFAQLEPVFVIPGKAGIPVLMQGVDVSWSVIEGEFGLDRPGSNKEVVYRPYALVVPEIGPPPAQPGYFPSTGRPPGYGRLEVVPPPNRRLPPPAPTYFRRWSSDSAPGPVTEYPALNPMPAVVWGGPQPAGRRWGRGAHFTAGGSARGRRAR